VPMGSVEDRPAPELPPAHGALSLRWVDSRSDFAVNVAIEPASGGPPLLKGQSGVLDLAPSALRPGDYKILAVLQSFGPCGSAPRLAGRVEVSGSMTEQRMIAINLTFPGCAGAAIGPVAIGKLSLR
jgi:hypothetical protein